MSLRRGVLLLLAAFTAPPLAAGQRVPPVASYRIDAAVDADHRLTGKETITFVNRTARPAEELRLHLYLNGFRNERSTFLTEVRVKAGRDTGYKPKEPRYGWIEVNRIASGDGTDLTAGARYDAPDDGNGEDRTVLVVPLPRAVGPGETARFDVDFSGRFPRAVARTGWKDDFLMGAQWFPKLGVLTAEGWNCHQFHATTEFFADFGDYDVTLTLPAEMKGRIGATGVLSEETDLPGNLVRAHFVANDVHDFAFTACARYEVYRDVFSHPGLPNVTIVLLLQPDHRAVKDRYFAAVKQGLAKYGEWFVPYPYPVLTVVDPPWGSNTTGMEYPTLISAGAHWLAPREGESPEGVTVHEFGHQIFYGLLASNEFEEAHLDEGFNTYATHRVMQEWKGALPVSRRLFDIPFVFRSVKEDFVPNSDVRYLDWQARVRSDATSVPSFRQLDGPATRTNAYAKTSLVLASCERTLGWPLWSRVLKTYAQRWAFRHPTTKDFRAVVKEVAGEKADDLLKETWDSTGTIDYAVTQATTARIRPAAGYFGDGTAMKYEPEGKPGGSYESVVVVRRMGDAVWPTDVELRFAGGAVVRRAWSGRERWIRYRVTGPKLLEAVVDPDRKDLLDVDLLNNSRKPEDAPRAGNRWGQKLRFLAQNVLEFFALVGFVR